MVCYRPGRAGRRSSEKGGLQLIKQDRTYQFRVAFAQTKALAPYSSLHAPGLANVCRCRVLKMQPQIDHTGPIMVPAGFDTFKSVGRPRSQGEGTVAGGLAEWRELFEKMFPGELWAGARLPVYR